jgi:hypothetical protein
MNAIPSQQNNKYQPSNGSDMCLHRSTVRYDLKLDDTSVELVSYTKCDDKTVWILIIEKSVFLKQISTGFHDWLQYINFLDTSAVYWCFFCKSQGGKQRTFVLEGWGVRVSMWERARIMLPVWSDVGMAPPWWTSFVAFFSGDDLCWECFKKLVAFVRSAKSARLRKLGLILSCKIQFEIKKDHRLNITAMK